MKLLLLLLLMYSSLHAQLKYDVLNDKFYSYPDHPAINQVYYNTIIKHCIRIAKDHYGTGRTTNQEIMQSICGYVAAYNNPTCIRVLEDIRAIGDVGWMIS